MRQGEATRGEVAALRAKCFERRTEYGAAELAEAEANGAEAKG